MSEDLRDKAFEDYKAGMKYKDIAEKYSVSLSAVKSWASRYWKKEGCNSATKKVATKKRKPKEVDSVINNSNLTDKQRLFCLYYSKSCNATRSYQKAYGCSYETAMVEGCNNLRNPKIKDEIMKLKQERYVRSFISEEDVFQKYWDIAFADITDFISFGRREVPVMGAFGPIETKDDDGNIVPLMKEINAVEFRESSEVDGSILAEVKQGKDGASIKLADRMKALQWLSDHMDLATAEQRARIDKIKADISKINGEGEEIEDLTETDDLIYGDK